MIDYNPHEKWTENLELAFYIILAVYRIYRFKPENLFFLSRYGLLIEFSYILEFEMNVGTLG